MSLRARFEAFLNEYPSTPDILQSAGYQVVDAARWILKTGNARSIPGMTEDHRGLLASVVYYGFEHMDRVTLTGKPSFDGSEIMFREDAALNQAGIGIRGRYGFAFAHPNAIILDGLHNNPPAMIHMMFARNTGHMAEFVRTMKYELKKTAIRVSYDINTNTIETNIGDNHKLYPAPEPYTPLVPAGHKPIAVWIGPIIKP